MSENDSFVGERALLLLYVLGSAELIVYICVCVLFLWLRSTALPLKLIVLDVAEAATAADARVAKLDDGLATGGLFSDAANNGVDDNEIVVEAGSKADDEQFSGISIWGPFSNALRS